MTKLLIALATTVALVGPAAAETYTYMCRVGDKPYPVTLTLEQTGTDVTGSIRIGGRPEVSGRVRGTVRGEVLQLSLATAAHMGGDLWVQQDNMMTSNAFGLHFTLRRSSQ